MKVTLSRVAKRWMESNIQTRAMLGRSSVISTGILHMWQLKFKALPSMILWFSECGTHSLCVRGRCNLTRLFRDHLSSISMFGLGRKLRKMTCTQLTMLPLSLLRSLSKNMILVHSQGIGCDWISRCERSNLGREITWEKPCGTSTQSTETSGEICLHRTAKSR